MGPSTVAYDVSAFGPVDCGTQVVAVSHFATFAIGLLHAAWSPVEPHTQGCQE